MALELKFEVGGQHTAAVNDAIYVPEVDGVITASDDKDVKVWLRRESGQFWPSVNLTMAQGATSLFYCPESRFLFVGLESGPISQYELHEDFNSAKLVTAYPSHQGRVTRIVYDHAEKTLISCGRDKSVFLNNTETIRVMAGVKTGAWCSSMAYDQGTKTVFVGDYSGIIHVIKIADGKMESTTKLQGHSASIRSLEWAADRRLLFSGSFDKTVICWDIGGGEGKSYELSGHTGKVKGLIYLKDEDKLLSAGDDSKLIVWDMSVERETNPEWTAAQTCEICKAPFFWNVSEMWASKTVSFARQHHCRLCGNAVCESCSQQRSTYPLKGHELAVRVCDSCIKSVEEEQLKPLASVHPLQHKVFRMRYEESTDTVLTCGDDFVVKAWDITPLLHPEQAADKKAKLDEKRSREKTKKAEKKAAAKQALDYAGEATDSAMGISYAGEEQQGSLLDMIND